MSGPINIIGVSLPNQIKQNKLKTVYRWSCCYKAGCHQIGGGVGGRRWWWWWGMRGWGASGFTKIVHSIYVFATGNLFAPPVALNHYNKVTIGFVIHKNLQKYVHDISELTATKWGRFNQQMSNSKMAAKTEDGGCKIGVSRLKRLVWPISTTLQNIKLLPKRVSDQFNK